MGPRRLARRAEPDGRGARARGIRKGARGIPARLWRLGAVERGARLDGRRAFPGSAGGAFAALRLRHAGRLAVFPSGGRPRIPDAGDPDDAADTRRDARVARACERRGAARLLSRCASRDRSPYDPRRDRGEVQGRPLREDPRRLACRRRVVSTSLGPGPRNAGAAQDGSGARRGFDGAARPRRHGRDGLAGPAAVKSASAERVPFWLVAIWLAILAIRILFLVQFRGNFDVESYDQVVEILRRGGRLYEDTSRYNYSPVW